MRMTTMIINFKQKDKITKNLISIISGGLLAMMFIVPAVSFASDNNNNKDHSENKKDLIEINTDGIKNNFCATIDAVDAKVLQSFGENENKRSLKESDGRNKFGGSRVDKEQQLEKRRSEWDEKRTNALNDLQIRAITEAQKTALSNFKAVVQAGIVSRRASIDAATKRYEEGVESVILLRRSSLSSAEQILKNSLNAAISRSKADCLSGVNSKKVKVNLKADLKNARKAFNEAISVRQKSNPSIQSLIDARNASVNKAVVDFNSLYNKARADLSASFSSSPRAH